MLDDDTYMFMENLRLYLRDFNPDLPFYIGNPSVFKGCDGIRKFGDGPQFAHGGSGILLSRAAIKAMLNIVDECVVKYSDCYWGDVRTGLCLRDAGILCKFKREGTIYTYIYIYDDILLK